jgi:hypothetical protein
MDGYITTTRYGGFLPKQGLSSLLRYSQWQNGRRGQDGWGRWTRRRKWYRDAELVEIEDGPEIIETEATPSEVLEPAQPFSPSITTSPYIPTTQGYSTIEEKMISPIRAEHAATSSDSSATMVTGNRTSEDLISTSLPSTSSTVDDPVSVPEKEAKDPSDSASILSTSSRSFFRSPVLRRRVTDRSVVSAVSTDSAAKDALRSVQERSRRASEAKSEEEAAALGVKGVELPEDGKDGWGIGDEARMMME